MGTAMEMRNDTKKAIRTLWSWLRGPLRTIKQDANAHWEPLVGVTTRLPSGPARTNAKGEPRAVSQVVAHDHVEQTGILLRFPLRGEALLVKLADLLRRRIANRTAIQGPDRDPLLLTMSRCPGSRLSIDRYSYVEFDADRSAYLVVIEAAPDTRIMLDTGDFDTAVNFVAQYIAERLAQPAALEVAS